MQKHALLVLLASLSLLAGCNGNYVGQNNSALLAATTPTYTGGIPNPWYLYDDSLKTGSWLQGLDFFSGGSFAGTPVIEFNSTIAPYRGTDCWHFSVPAQTGSWFCGVILLQGSNFGDSNGKPGVDISSGNFTKCVLMARCAQGANQVNFQALNATNTITANVNSSWQSFSIPFTNTTAMTAVRQFLAVVLANSAPSTTTPIDLYIDDVRFQQ
jgi:hypothetical protein